MRAEPPLSPLQQRVRETAARMLSRRPLSCKGLGDKLLEKGFPELEVAQTLRWLEELGYLNDREYALWVIRSYRSRGYGPMRMRQELRRRGVSQELCEELLAECGENGEAIDAFLKKKLGGPAADRRELKRAADALARRGFSYEEIRSGLRRYTKLEEWD